MSRDKIVDFFEEDNSHDSVPLADGFEGAFIGIVRSFNSTSALYDYSKCVSILVERDGLLEEDAEEFLEYNVLNAYVGENTPSFLMKKFIDS